MSCWAEVTCQLLFNTDKAGAAELMTEPKMIEGFFRYCAVRNIVNVNLGGLRFDPYGPEAKAWQEYSKHVSMSRKELFRQITDATLDDRQCQREAHLPVESFDLHNSLYTGVTYRQIEYDDLGIPSNAETKDKNTSKKSSTSGARVYWLILTTTHQGPRLDGRPPRPAIPHSRSQGSDAAWCLDQRRESAETR